jgi:hypothetical protein
MPGGRAANYRQGRKNILVNHNVNTTAYTSCDDDDDVGISLLPTMIVSAKCNQRPETIFELYNV